MSVARRQLPGLPSRGTVILLSPTGPRGDRAPVDGICPLFRGRVWSAGAVVPAVAAGWHLLFKPDITMTKLSPKYKSLYYDIIVKCWFLAQASV